MIGTNGSDCSLEGELEALRHVVAALQGQLRTLYAEAGISEDAAFADGPDQNGELGYVGAPPGLEASSATANGTSPGSMARRCVGGLADQDSPVECLEADGAADFAAELHALQDWFKRAVSTATVLLDQRDARLRQSPRCDA